MAKRISVNEGSNETIRWAVRPSGRPAVEGQPRSNGRTTNSTRFTVPPSRELHGGANEDVSWLRADRGAFPRNTSVAGPRLEGRSMLRPYIPTTARYSGGGAPAAHPLPRA